MKLLLDLTIPGEPIAQPRARACMIAGRTRMYTPTTTGKGAAKKSNGVAEYKALVRKLAAEQYRGPLAEGPLRVDCIFVFTRPGRLRWKKRPMLRVPHQARPDRDNCDKAVLDALTGIIWHNDQQVAGGEIWKWYASGDEQPHTRIRVFEFEAGEPVGGRK